MLYHADHPVSGYFLAKMTTTFVFGTVIKPRLADDRLLPLNYEECDVMAFGKLESELCIS
jgi:hypothetical protein